MNTDYSVLKFINWNTLMSETDKNKDELEESTYRELRLLEEVEIKPEVSQRHLANQLGVALGVANLLVKNLAKKGYIRATRAGWKRWVYNLTPAGIGRKAQLTARYVERVLDHYSRVRMLLQKDFQDVSFSAESRMAIYGTGELAELMYMILKEMGVTQIDFVDKDGDKEFLNKKVLPLIAMDPTKYMKIMVAYSSEIEIERNTLINHGISEGQIVTLLGTSRDEVTSHLGEVS